MHTAAARWLKVAIALPVVVVALLLFPPARADAYVHTWNCNWGLGAYSGCYDFSGQQYNPWQYVVGGFGSQLPSGYNGLCVKAVTAAGNIKSGSDCWAANFTIHGISIAASPNSQGYYYFGGSGTSTNNTGRADTF